MISKAQRERERESIVTDSTNTCVNGLCGLATSGRSTMEKRKTRKIPEIKRKTRATHA